MYICKWITSLDFPSQLTSLKSNCAFRIFFTISTWLKEGESNALKQFASSGKYKIGDMKNTHGHLTCLHPDQTGGNRLLASKLRRPNSTHPPVCKTCVHLMCAWTWVIDENDSLILYKHDLAELPVRSMPMFQWHPRQKLDAHSR